jgi:uncharacterized protein with GYD domain
MRILKITMLVAVILSISGLLAAKQNKYGVADVRKVTFSSSMRVGDVMLPQGDYEVRHVMEADNHMMAFKQLVKKNPAEARVPCKLVPLNAKAQNDQLSYTVNAANERVLQVLRFSGDLAEHVF